MYTVTFMLPGFTTLRREGIELTTGFTATVNADMSVGAIAETVTVSGAAPLVDTQNVNQQRVFSRTVTEQLPSSSTLNQYATLIPGAVLTSGASAQDVGGSRGEFQTGFTIHGARTNDFQQMRDGMFWGTLVAAGNKMSSLNQATVDEVTVQTSGATAEAESGGVLVNVVPRDGGNTFRASFAGNFANQGLQSNNLDDDLRARAVTVVAEIRKRYDVGGGVGGPMLRDKLWFFASSRYWVTSTYVPGNYFNATQGTLFYTPDLDRPLYDENSYFDNRLRLTWQASERHKIAATYGVERNCNCLNNVSTGMRDAAASGSAKYWPNRNGQLTWNSPTTNRLLFEGGVTFVSLVQQRLRVGSTPGDPAVLDQARNYRYGNHRFGYGLSDSFGYQKTFQMNEKFAASYVTGSHSFKAGLQYLYAPRETYFYQDGGPYADRSYTFLGTTPVSVTYYAGPLATSLLQQTLGVFAQDQWSVQRLTLNLGVRFDYLNGKVDEQHMPAGTFVPARDFAAVENVPNWKDINPRIGASYDLFGTGRTALKAFIGRYVNFEAFGITTANNPANLLVLSATRTWTDNGDYVPQEAELGPLSDSAFGQVRQATTRYADDVVNGFGVRPYNWQGSVQLQHELGGGHRAQRRVLPHLVRQLLRHRQPGDRPRGLQRVLHQRTDPRESAGGRERQADLWSLRPASGEVRPGGQPRRAGVGLRRLQRGIQRRRRVVEHALRRRRRAAGRHRDRQPEHRSVLRRGLSAGACISATWRRRGQAARSSRRSRCIRCRGTCRSAAPTRTARRCRPTQGSSRPTP